MNDGASYRAAIWWRWRPLRALQHRAFRVFFEGQTVSIIGNWMQSTALTWYVLTTTRSPLLLGVITALQFAPVLLLAPFGGVVADRLPKRAVLLGAQSCLMAISLMLGIITWTGQAHFWLLAALACTIGVANSFEFPARHSFFAELVAREHLTNAIALNAVTFTVGRMVGPAVAGIIIARLGVAPVFWLNAATYVAVLAALLTIRSPSLPRRVRTHVVLQIAEGLQYVRTTPQILSAVITVGTMGILVINFNVLIPILVTEVLRGDARVYGFLMSALGLGALGGALGVASRSGIRPRWTTISRAAGGVAVVVVLSGWATDVRTAAVLAASAGFLMMTFIASTNGYIQGFVPDALRGRVMSVYSMVNTGSTPLGALFTGWLLSIWPPRSVFALEGGLGLIAALTLAVWTQRRLQGTRRSFQSNSQAIDIKSGEGIQLSTGERDRSAE